MILRHFRAAGCLYAEKYEVSDLAREEKHGIAAAEDIFNGDIIGLVRGGVAPPENEKSIPIGMLRSLRQVDKKDA